MDYPCDSRQATTIPIYVSPPPQPETDRERPGEERVDVRRYLGAIRQSAGLIAAIVLLTTGVVAAVSLALPKSYQGTTSIVLEEADNPLSQPDAESVRRRLNTLQALLTSPTVLEVAARTVPGESRDSLERKIRSAAEPEANIIEITVDDGSAEGAAAIANGVAQTFLTERTRLERESLARARQRLEAELTQLEASPTAAVQIPILRERISQLRVSEEVAGSDLHQVSAAETPAAANSPRPLRNAVLAIFGSLFFAVLLALGRDQLSPRVGAPRDLGRALDLRVLAGVPYVRGRRRRRAQVMSGVEAEAYETLRSLVELSAPPETTQVVLITGAVHGEGKTTASWRLGHALARAGHRVLVGSADLRVPRLHEIAKVPLGLGLSDVLAMIDWEGGEPDAAILDQAIKEMVTAGPGKRKQGALHLITSGTKAKDPGRLISGPGMPAFLRFIRDLDYAYVIVDAPPLLGIADSQVLARYADRMVLVHRLDRLTLDHVADLRQVLDGLELVPMGIVVIGARSEVSPYYLQRRPPIVQSGLETR